MNPIFHRFKSFVKSQQFNGILLLSCTAFSLLLSNLSWCTGYLNFWKISFSASIAQHHLPDSPILLINDFLMAFFFLVVGLEIRKEIVSGDLSNFKSASLPVAAAIGGMIAPALIYFCLNNGSSTQTGWGIPMATDIAFALGILSLSGKRVPTSLKLLLTTLAVADDLGAVLVIALFYSHGLSTVYLISSILLFILLLLANRSGIKNDFFYILAGVLLWYLIHSSGVHATVAGVLMALVLPDEIIANKKGLQSLEHAVNYAVIPLFALANTAIVLQPNWSASLVEPASIGIILGLLFGKPAGILSAVYLGVKCKITQLPKEINFRHLAGVGFLGGIGFTMSIFISLLAFELVDITNQAKVAIMLASLISGLTGFLILRFSSKQVDR